MSFHSRKSNWGATIRLLVGGGGFAAVFELDNFLFQNLQFLFISHSVSSKVFISLYFFKICRLLGWKSPLTFDPAFSC